MKNPFPRLCKFSSISGFPGYNLTPLFLFPPPAVIFLAGQNFPSARRFKPRCALLSFAFACPIRGHAPLTLFGFYPHLRFPSASQPARSLPLRLCAPFASVPHRPRRPRWPCTPSPLAALGFFPSCTVSRLSKRRLSVFSLGKPFWAVSRLLSAFFAAPSGGFPPLCSFQLHKKRTGTWPAPVFFT